MPKAFLDTNILLYPCLTNTKDDPTELARKQAIATNLTHSDQLVISTQVVNEVCANLIKKANFAEAEIQPFIRLLFNRYQVVQLSYDIFLKASTLRESYCFSYWDSLIVASALAGNVDTLYSEDMQHGLIVDNQLTIINPFKLEK